VKVTLAPILDRDEFSVPTEKAIKAYFREVLFDPLRDRIPTRENATDPLHTALIEGTIVYADGVFTGTFNATLSRRLRELGAQRRGEGFALAQADIPYPLRGAIAESKRRGEQAHEDALALLAIIAAHLATARTGIDLRNTVDVVLDDLQKQFVSSVSSATTPPALPLGAGSMAQGEFGAAVERDIKTFTTEAVHDLQRKIQQNLGMGARLDRLGRILDAMEGQAQRRAAKIAREETARMVARFRESRYADIGITSYLWDTSHDDLVRPTHGESNNHRRLDGRVFSFSSPPIVDTATGRRCNPGEDYGPCRCTALPVWNT